MDFSNSTVKNITQNTGYDTIQAAIDNAVDGDVIVVSPGQYDEDINFNGKAVTVKGDNTNDWSVIGSTIINGSVAFDSDEGNDSVIEGITITADAAVSASINCINSQPIIRNCLINGNSQNGITIDSASPIIENNKITGHENGILITFAYGSAPDIKNNIIYENNNGMVINGSNPAQITNNTIADNTSYGIKKGDGRVRPTIANCIIWGNGIDVSSRFRLRYCCASGVKARNGNINADPLFVDPANDDYHLRSELGRCDATTKSWVTDSVTSPCIDAGDPDADYISEMWPCGYRINIGAYGGTNQASMSPNPVGSPADFNKDGSTDITDLIGLSQQWLSGDFLVPQDINHDNIINAIDFVLFAESWQLQQAMALIE